MKWWFRVRVLKVGTRPLYRGPCVYLFNHRSWGDFIVDQYASEGRSLFMSRRAGGAWGSVMGNGQQPAGEPGAASGATRRRKVPCLLQRPA